MVKIRTYHYSCWWLRFALNKPLLLVGRLRGGLAADDELARLKAQE